MKPLPSKPVTNPLIIFTNKGWRKRRPSFLFFFTVFALLLNSCDKVGNQRIIEYNGPVREGDSIEMLYAEEDKLKVKMIAGKVRQFDNGDREFPEGLFLEFYDSLQVTSTMTANNAYYYKSTNKWRAQGKVTVKSEVKDEQLNTEELFWFPTTKKIYTEKFVTIRTGTEVIYGTGLDADQDLTNYRIRRVEGEFEVDENGTQNPD
ncbi:MAG: LPS export ABC transporter periplasmic protein LptC [Cyclobacteriaceae bacterium]